MIVARVHKKFYALVVVVVIVCLYVSIINENFGYDPSNILSRSLLDKIRRRKVLRAVASSSPVADQRR